MKEIFSSFFSSANIIVRAALIARCFYSCPCRALGGFIRLPRALPWAMETLGFQPVFAQTLLVTSLRKRYWSRPCTYVVGIVSLQRWWFHVLANP